MPLDHVYHGRDRHFVLLDEHSLAASPLTEFRTVENIFDAVASTFDGEWESDGSRGVVGVSSVVSQRLDAAYSARFLFSEERPAHCAPVSGVWAKALHTAANASLFEKIDTSRLATPGFAEEMRAVWRQNLRTAADCPPDPDSYWSDLHIPMMLLRSLDMGCVPGFAFPDALFTEFALVSFDWRKGLAQINRLDCPEVDGHWIIAELVKMPFQADLERRLYAGPRPL